MQAPEPSLSISWPLRARPTVGPGAPPANPGYPRVSKFGEPFQARCPQTSHDRASQSLSSRLERPLAGIGEDRDPATVPFEYRAAVTRDDAEPWPDHERRCAGAAEKDRAAERIAGDGAGRRPR